MNCDAEKPYTIRPLNPALYQACVKPQQYDAYKFNIFGEEDPEEVLQCLEMSGCRFDFFAVFRGKKLAFDPEDLVALIAIQWYPRDDCLVPMFHWDIFPGGGRESLDMAAGVIHSFCNHFKLQRLTGWIPSMTSQAEKFFRVLFKYDPEVKQRIKFIDTLPA